MRNGIYDLENFHNYHRFMLMPNIDCCDKKSVEIKTRFGKLSVRDFLSALILRRYPPWYLIFRQKMCMHNQGWQKDVTYCN